MAGWLHGVCVSACLFVPPQCGFSLSLFCNHMFIYIYINIYMCTCDDACVRPPTGETMIKQHVPSMLTVYGIIIIMKKLKLAQRWRTREPGAAPSGCMLRAAVNAR